MATPTIHPINTILPMEAPSGTLVENRDGDVWVSDGARWERVPDAAAAHLRRLVALSEVRDRSLDTAARVATAWAVYARKLQQRCAEHAVPGEIAALRRESFENLPEEATR